jgi:hypothetical protein
MKCIKCIIIQKRKLFLLLSSVGFTPMKNNFFCSLIVLLIIVNVIKAYLEAVEGSCEP